MGELNNILGDRLLLKFCEKFQRTKLKFHLRNYIICDSNVPYVSVVPRWSRKFKMLWMKMSGRGIPRRFREPQRTKEHIKNSSNRYFVEKLVNLSQILCSKPFSAWYLNENSPSKDKTFKVHITPCKVIRIPECGKFCLWNPESSENSFLWNWKSWTWESGIQLKKSWIPLTIEIRNPSSTNKESKIYCLESRIQDCLAFTYINNVTHKS